MAHIRLFLDEPLSEGQIVPLSRDQSHYLFGVMRLGVGAELRVFDGESGERAAVVEETGKRAGSLRIGTQTAPHLPPADLWLLFAPLKKARTDFIVEKAVELGAARLQPVLTRFTNAERVRVDRLQAHAVEAAEQCGATAVPVVAAPAKLSALLAGWDPTRHLIFCDEGAAGQVLTWPEVRAPGAVLIGPEGGFSDDERKALTGLPCGHPVALGPRILRAETAAVAALTLWQTRIGDWG